MSIIRIIWLALLVVGGALFVAGVAIFATLGSNMTVDQSDITEEEIQALIEQNIDDALLGGMVVGVGILLLVAGLIALVVDFVLRRRRR